MIEPRSENSSHRSTKLPRLFLEASTAADHWARLPQRIVKSQKTAGVPVSSWQLLVASSMARAGQLAVLAALLLLGLAAADEHTHRVRAAS